MKDILKELEELAGKAAPGPWVATGVTRGGFNIWSQADNRPAWIICSRNEIDYREADSEANAHFIAACSPETILALVRVAGEAVNLIATYPEAVDEFSELKLAANALQEARKATK